MKTDRELLELAAKAVGIEGYIHEWINGPEFIIPGENPVTWNPLSDDGDALRLAVKLRITVSIGADAVEAHIGAADGSLEVFRRAPYAATRRAIVRAAAEVGKSI